MADFAVRDNELINFGSHNADNDNPLFKSYDNPNELGAWIEVRYLKEGMEIAVPDYSTGAIKWEKISSITILEPQHVYDLSIEGTRNFIANDIVAHNTYLATSSGNVGIGTATPNYRLQVVDTGATTAVNLSDVLYVDASNNRVGISNSIPSFPLDVNGTSTATIRLTTTDGARLRMDSTGGGDNRNWAIYTSNAVSGDFGIKQSNSAGADPMDGTARIHIALSGNVGIGTIAPNAKLVVIGGANISGGLNVTAGDVLLATASGNVGIGTTAPNVKLTVIGGANISAGLNVTAGDVLLASSSGNVGIGTTTPDQELHVIGNVTINDSTGLNSIQIDSENNAILFEGENGSLYQPVWGSDDDLVLYLPFSEFTNLNKSNTTYDRSPYGNDGVLSGMNQDGRINNSAWVKGKIGYAMGFEEADSAITVRHPTDGSMNFDNGSVSISWWFACKPNDCQGSGDGWNLYKRESSTDQGFSTQIASAGTIGCYFDDGPDGVNTVTTKTFNEGNWHHVVCMKDGSISRLYVDGVQHASRSLSTIDLGITINANLIFADRGAEHFNGVMDEIMIYKRALSPDEVRAHYLRGSGYGASGVITADKFRIVNTSGFRKLELNQSGFGVYINASPSILVNKSGDINLGSTMFVDDKNNRVGIGTTSPGSKLDLRDGNLDFTDADVAHGATELLPTNVFSRLAPESGVAGGIRFTGGTETDIAINLNGFAAVPSTDGNGAVIRIRAAKISGTSETSLADNEDMLTVGNQGVELFFIKGSGNVGIGTTAPNDILEAVGNVRVSGAINASRLNITGQTLLATASGNVGIGTTLPNDKLEISAASPFININGTTGNFGIRFSRQDLQKSATIQGGGGNGGDLAFLSQTTEVVRIVDGGNVGISDTTSDALLEVSASGGATDIFMLSSDDANDGNRFIVKNSGNVGIGTTTPNYRLQVVDTASTTAVNLSDVLFVDASNNRVGINNANPLFDLDINRSSVTTIRITSGDGIRLLLSTTDTQSTARNWAWATGNVEAGDFIIRQSDTIGGVAMDGTARFYIRNTGNVGIGTTSPNTKLTVIGGINASGGLNVTAGDVLLATESGNVGIGTTAPSNKLVVVGNLSINDSTGANQNILIDSTNDAILFTGNNGSMFMPTYASDDDLVLYLPFDTGGNTTSGAGFATSNSTVKDRSPYGNDGQCYGYSTIDGCNWTTGKYGYALYFNQTSASTSPASHHSYVDIAGSSSSTHPLNINNDVTIMLWLKRNRLAAAVGEMGVIGSHGGSPRSGYGIGIGAGNDLQFIYGNQSGTNINVAASTTLTSTDWNHVVGIKRGKVAEIWVNGVLRATTDGGDDSAIRTADTTFRIGATGSSDDFDGSIDEVFVYRRALAPEEIRTHYLHGKGYGASGVITADKFRIINTTGGKKLELNQSGFGVYINQSPIISVNKSDVRLGNTLMVNDLTNRVGIGTTSPTVKVQVKGTATDPVVATYNGIFGLESAAETSFQMGIGSSFSGTWFQSYNQPATADERSFPLIFNPLGGNVGINDTSPSGALDVDTNVADTLVVVNGRVGIGTASPTEALTIDGNINFVGAQTINTSTGQLTLGSGGQNVLRLDGATTSTNTVTALAVDMASVNIDGNNRIFRAISLDNPVVTLDGGGSFTDAWSYIQIDNPSVTLDAAIATTISTFNMMMMDDISPTHASLTITNRTTIRLRETSSPTGTITNNYGIFIDNKRDGTNDYGIYVEGADTAAAYFGDMVGINDSTPSYTLDVDGQVRGNFTSSDGSKGLTASCASTTTLTVKNGLITACA